MWLAINIPVFYSQAVRIFMRLRFLIVKPLTYVKNNGVLLMNDLDAELVVSGMNCPMPLIHLSQSVGELGSGEPLKIVGMALFLSRRTVIVVGLINLKLSVCRLSMGRKIELVINKIDDRRVLDL